MLLPVPVAGVRCRVPQPVCTDAGAFADPTPDRKNEASVRDMGPSPARNARQALLHMRLAGASCEACDDFIVRPAAPAQCCVAPDGCRKASRRAMRCRRRRCANIYQARQGRIRATLRHMAYSLRLLTAAASTTIRSAATLCSIELDNGVPSVWSSNRTGGTPFALG